MEVTAVEVRSKSGTMDTLIVTTDLPTPKVFPNQKPRALPFVTYLPKGEGVGYAKEHFPGVPLTVVKGSQ